MTIAQLDSRNPSQRELCCTATVVGVFTAVSCFEVAVCPVECIPVAIAGTAWSLLKILEDCEDHTYQRYQQRSLNQRVTTQRFTHQKVPLPQPPPCWTWRKTDNPRIFRSITCLWEVYLFSLFLLSETRVIRNFPLGIYLSFLYTARRCFRRTNDVTQRVLWTFLCWLWLPNPTVFCLEDGPLSLPSPF